MKSAVILTVLFMPLVFSCKNMTQIPSDFDYGKIEDSTYINEFFDLRMPIVAGWEQVKPSLIDSIKSASKDELSDDDVQKQDQYQESESRTAQLLTIYTSDPTTFAIFNPNITFMAENVKMAIQVKNGEDYLESVKKNLDISDYHVEYTGNIKSIKFGAEEFYMMEVINHFNGMDIHQAYYADIIKGYALAFVASWMTNDQKQRVREQLGKLNFE